jgi:hypothetical protein
VGCVSSCAQDWSQLAAARQPGRGREEEEEEEEETRRFIDKTEIKRQDQLPEEKEEEEDGIVLYSGSTEVLG